ncbi:hypothetical protein CAMSH0001_1874 [Campylobacter showae RM3277]|uniref:Uncharacterized protein n=1 Tax=Campylobacter showae RM3277 TaxID=553219 RepID=C6RDF9_9BACT|nr:hypothetical protein CAMSH0001_1874 [Campylobacter showae RM3277]
MQNLALKCLTKRRRDEPNLASIKFAPLKFSQLKPASPKLGVKF